MHRYISFSVSSVHIVNTTGSPGQVHVASPYMSSHVLACLHCVHRTYSVHPITSALTLLTLGNGDTSQRSSVAGQWSVQRWGGGAHWERGSCSWLGFRSTTVVPRMELSGPSAVDVLLFGPPPCPVEHEGGTGRTAPAPPPLVWEQTLEWGADVFCL